MADKTVWDYPEAGTLSGEHILYLLQGLSSDRDRRLPLSDLLSFIQSEKLDTIDTNISNLGSSKADKTITISAGTGLLGGGDLSTNRTLSARAASTSQSGIAQLSDSISETSSVKAATPTAVKTVQDNLTTLDAAVVKLLGDQSISDEKIFENLIKATPYSWSTLGSPLSISGNEWPSLASLSLTRIAFVDRVLEQLRAYDFDGTNWSQVGNSLSIPGIGGPCISALSSSRIAFSDASTGLAQLRAYDFDGTNWSLVGSGLSIAGMGFTSICALSGNRVAYTDWTLDVLRTYDFDGTNWSQVGNSLSITDLGVSSVSALSSNRVALMDTGNDELKTYDFDGTNWSLVGVALSVPTMTGPSLATLSPRRVAVVDRTIEELRVYAFTGYTWERIGTALSISGTEYPAITPLASNKLAFIDSTIGNLQAYELSFELPPLPIFN